MNAHADRHHRLRNGLHSVMMLGGMGGLLALIGYLLSGWSGVIWLVLLWTAAVWFAPRISPRWTLRMLNAYPLHPAQAPTLYRMVADLSEKAELPRLPQLYYIPSGTPNAVSLGDHNDPYIAVSDGLLQGLTQRELRGVMAHEIAHIRNHDLWLMNLADSISRLTSLISLAGQLLLLLQLPLLLFATRSIPWLLLLLLIVAPMLSRLLQLALSRTREFEADREAARLTQDPMALASALQRIERSQFSLWRLFFPVPTPQLPSALRTHPPTRERIARLEEMRLPTEPRRSPPTAPPPHRFWRKPLRNNIRIITLE